MKRNASGLPVKLFSDTTFDMQILLSLFLLLSLATPVMAGNNMDAAIVKGDFSRMKHTASTRVDKVIDAQTVLMKDGKIIRLLGMEYPADESEAIADEVLAAKNRLAALLPENTEVMLYQSFNSKTGRMNRMGHTLAHLVGKKDERWINGSLIAEGYGWAITDADNPDMADQLYALEAKARTAKLGLWQDNSVYSLLSPENAGNAEGKFRIVEGRVNRAASMRNKLYLNFGNDWRKDFTVMITPQMRKALARQQVDPINLAGQTVRVRGWIRNWNGPFMELETPERLEIVPQKDDFQEAVEEVAPAKTTRQNTINP
jgi:micrococcal nuclease